MEGARGLVFRTDRQPRPPAWFLPVWERHRHAGTDNLQRLSGAVSRGLTPLALEGTANQRPGPKLHRASQQLPHPRTPRRTLAPKDPKRLQTFAHSGPFCRYQNNYRASQPVFPYSSGVPPQAARASGGPRPPGGKKDGSSRRLAVLARQAWRTWRLQVGPGSRVWSSFSAPRPTMALGM